MKKSAIIFLFLIANFLTSIYANWYEINTNGQVISFSRIAIEGKISVFILCTNWCSPCKALKSRIMDTLFDLKKIDFYFVNMSGEMKYAQLKQTNGYKIWRKIEQISAWPTVYIAAQTTNIVSSFSAEDEPYPFDKIVKITSDLLEEGKTFDQNTMFKGMVRRVSELHEIEPNNDSEQNIIVNPKYRLPIENQKNDQYSKQCKNATFSPQQKYRILVASQSIRPPQQKLKELEKFGKLSVVVKNKKCIIYLNEIDTDSIEIIKCELEDIGFSNVKLEQLN